MSEGGFFGRAASLAAGFFGRSTPAPPPPDLTGPDGKPAELRSPIDFGPGYPLPPRFAGDLAPREYQYPIGFNLIATPRGEEPGLRFPQMRALALLCPQLRAGFNYIQGQIVGKQGSFSAVDARSPAARKSVQPQIERAKEFWVEPNRLDRLRFPAWKIQLLEDILVCDAGVLYKHLTADGSLHSLVQIDCATIKPIIDAFGHVCAYQQILYGYPTTQYGAYGAPVSSRVAGSVAPGRMEYLIAKPKSNGVYGTSIIEEIKGIIDVAARRLITQLNWYTEGNVPVATLACPPDWTPGQIRDAQILLNEEIAGIDPARAKIRLLPMAPGGAGGKLDILKGYQFNKDESEDIGRLVSAALGVPASLFVAQVNRAAGETMQDQSEDAGLQPRLQALADLINDITQNDLHCPDIEYQWGTRAAGTELQLAQARSFDVSSGVKTVNEAREELGLEAIEEEEKPTAPPLPGQAPKVTGDATPEPRLPPADTAAAKAELATWHRWAEKRITRGRHVEKFLTVHVPEYVRGVVAMGLAQATTPDELRGLFSAANDALEKKARLTASSKKRHIADMTRATMTHLDKQRKDFEKHAREKIG